jgi:hypothetical protein
LIGVARPQPRWFFEGLSSELPFIVVLGVTSRFWGAMASRGQASQAPRLAENMVRKQGVKKRARAAE